MHRIRRALLIAAFALVIPTASVFAATATIYGHLHHDGSLTQFSTWRYHDHTGTISMYVDNLPNGGGQLRLGLRDTGGTQFTNTTTWTAFGSKEFTLASSGSNQIGAISFAINGRMDACGIFCDDDFGGTLAY
jgi:hypothetical protein